MKRENYLNWDEYFMGIALLSSQRSKDPSTQVGSCIVNEDRRIMSVGYNGMPCGCSDDEWNEREMCWILSTYLYAMQNLMQFLILTADP